MSYYQTLTVISVLSSVVIMATALFPSRGVTVFLPPSNDLGWCQYSTWYRHSIIFIYIPSVWEMHTVELQGMENKHTAPTELELKADDVNLDSVKN